MLNSKYAGLLTLTTLLSLGAATRSQGQNLGNSPYSRLGLGDTNFNTGGIRQNGMGGVGLAAPNGAQVNELNPALLYYINRTTWEIGLTGQYKTVRNNLTSQKTGSASLGYLALAVPITTRWGAAIGLKPYSAVDYQSVETRPIYQASVVNQYSGQGDLSEAYFGQAIRLAKGLSLGVTASYVFGSIDLLTGTQLVPDEVTSTDELNRVVLRNHVHYSDFKFRGGLHYRGKFGDKLNYNLGGVYGFQTRLNGDQSITRELQGVAGNLIAEPEVQSSGAGKATIPALAQGGISIDNNKNWSINADVAHQQWSKFQAFSMTGGTAGIPLDNTFRAAIGGEYAPDPSSVENYFKRVSYRVGVSLAEMPYRPGGQTLYDRAISWGFSFPISATALDASTLNMAFSYGQRGNTDTRTLSNGSVERNIKETYIRAQVGISLNNRWFIKRRIE